MRSKSFLAASAVLLFPLIFVLPQPATAAPDQEALARVLIAFDGPPGLDGDNLVRGVGGFVKHNYHLVPALAASIPPTAIPGLMKNPRVVRVEPDIEVFAVGQTVPWGVERVGAPAAHAAGNTGRGVKVAVLDTGVNTNHPDIAVAGGIRFFTVTGGKPSGRGSFSDGNYNDGDGHGTHVCGTIAARDNDSGVLGVAPGVSLYAVKVLGDDGSGNYSDVIAGLQWAVDNGMQITNNSYGSSTDPGATVKQAFDNARAAGLLNIAAAGNESGRAVIYPARYDSVVAVSAVDSDGALAYFSSIGPEVELAAPGVAIFSTHLAGYDTLSGTSMASPHVTGAAALVLAANPGWTNEQVRARLQSTATSLGLSADKQGYGLVNAAAALGLTVVPPPPPPPPPAAKTVALQINITTEQTAVRKNVFMNASAAVTVQDADGNPVAGATVTASWSGLVTGSSSVVTGADGVAVFLSGQTKKTAGTFTLTVQGVSFEGSACILQGETSDSVSL